MTVIDANKNSLYVRYKEKYTSGSANVYPVQFNFDSAWEGMAIVPVFRAGGKAISAALNSENICEIPWEVLDKPGLMLEAGVEGTKADGTVLPTIWAQLGQILEGTEPGENAKEPTPDVYAQIIEQLDKGVKNAQDAASNANEAAVKAETAAVNPPKIGANGNWYVWDFEAGAYVDTGVAASGGGGAGGTTDHNNLSNRNAADQHPISAITGLEKVLDDKQPVGNYLIDESDPTVPAWAKAKQKPEYTAKEVGADPSGTAAGLVSAHNTAGAAHSDIRLLITGLTQRLNALADSDDTTLDQLSEIVAYIKSNRDLISSITTEKVGVADIVNDLVTNVSNKPLSAAQGVALKALIDAIKIPDKLPNPNALTFTGAATGSYDGSAPMEVNIPSGGGSGGSGKTLTLIAELTLEDEAHFSITKDSDGNNISESEIIITAYIAPYSANRDIGIIIVNEQGTETILDNYGLKTGTSGVYHEHRIWATDEYLIDYHSQHTSLSSTANRSFSVRMVNFSGKICGIKSQYLAPPAGSVIKLCAWR